MKIHRFVMGCAVLALTACASKPPVAYVKMSYASSPSGALVVRDGVTVGRTPVSLIVKAPLLVSAADGSVTSECMTPDPVKFKWASGAETTVTDPCQTSRENSSVFQKAPGSKKQYTASIAMSASRPQDAPGLKRDERTATGLSMYASIPFPAPRVDYERERQAALSPYGYQSSGVNGYIYYPANRQ